MAEFVASGRLPYSDVAGLASVRATAASFVNHFYGMGRTFSAENVIITAGGIQACYVTMALMVERGTDVVLSSLPAYSLYKAQTCYFGGAFVPLELESGARAAKALRGAFEAQRRLGRRVRVVVLCTPNNPSGRSLDEAEAAALGEVLDEELDRQPDGFLVLLDEVYLGIEAGAHVSLISKASRRLLRRICLVLSASKGLGAMPGARAAWVTAADAELVEAMVRVQGIASANASTISQVGLEATLQHCLDDPAALPAVRDYYAERTRFMARGLNALAARHGLGRVCSEPQGTFYVWADFSSLGPAVRDDRELQRLLLDAPGTGVAVVPGSAFCMEPSQKLIRINCARDDLEDLKRGLDVFDRLLTQLDRR